MSGIGQSRGFTTATVGAWLVILFLVLPIVVVAPVSLTDKRYLSLPTEGISFRHYATIFTENHWVGSAWHSLIVGVSSAVLATMLGTFAAVGCWRLASRGMELARTLLLAPMIVPPIVHALGFYRVWVDFGLIDTFSGLIIAHTVKGIPFVVVTVTASLANFDHRIEQAARNLGCTPVQALLKVVVPSIRPGVAAGAILAFITSWDEVVVMLFITSRHVHTLPRQIWDGLQDNLSPSIAAVATLMVVATLAVLLVRTLIQRRHAARSVAS